MSNSQEAQPTEPNRVWRRELRPFSKKRISEVCKAMHIDSDWHRHWCAEMKEQPRMHRKQWEHTYILQALHERGCIQPGKRGLAFAVGTEPLPAVLAKHGCEIVATDLNPEEGTKLGWTNGNQLCFGVDSLNTRGICDATLFNERVTYRAVNMNNIPKDLTDFDFNWSSCSFEHLGSIKKGMAFIQNQLSTLKHGGWAVHTTEYNISSNTETQDNNKSTVIFRQRDIDEMVKLLRDSGHVVEEVDYSLGGQPEDFAVDLFPYSQNVHLKLQLEKYVVTSIGLIIQKQGNALQKRKKFWFF